MSKGTETFAFESESWDECVDQTFVLTVPFRQRDPELLQILNEVRKGTHAITPETIERLRGTQDTNLSELSGDVIPTKLHSHNRRVDSINAEELNRLPGDSIVYEADDWGANKQHLLQLDKNCMATQRLELKV